MDICTHTHDTMSFEGFGDGEGLNMVVQAINSVWFGGRGSSGHIHAASTMNYVPGLHLFLPFSKFQKPALKLMFP